jgi:hypothetical protein
MAVTSLAVPKGKPAIPVGGREPLHGFGAQLNTYVFTKTGSEFTRINRQGQNLTEDQHGRLADAIKEAEPGHCRIFVQRGLNPDSPRGLDAPGFRALMETIKMANDAGAETVNLTWWGQGPYALKENLRKLKWPNDDVLTGWPHSGLAKWPPELTQPDAPGALPGPREQMGRFARIVHEARRRFPCVTHATIQNEVNGAQTDIAMQGVPNLAMRLYERLYRDFADALTRLDDPQGDFPNLRLAIKIVAGDLVQQGKGDADHQDAWIRYLHANMDRPREGFPSVLDAYSIHVYWKPGPPPNGEFPGKATKRLDNLETLAKDLGISKPIFVTEYGVRFPIKTESERPGMLDDVPMERAPESVFEHAWFMARAPQKGCVGLVKWVMYRTDMRTGWGKWGLIDAPSTDFKRTPMFHLSRLFNRLAGKDWNAAGLLERDDFLISRFSAPTGDDESIVVLNSRHEARDLHLTNLSKSRRYERAAINQAGRGELSRPDAFTTGNPGEMTISVPARGLVALSTRPIGLQPPVE